MLYTAGHGDVTTLTPINCQGPLEIRLQSHGDVNLTVNAPAIKLNTNCHGNTTLKGSCGDLNIKHVSHGDIDCSEMIADHVVLHNVAHGDLKLYSKEDIVIKNFGHGNIYYYGPGRLKDIRQFGHGEIRHKDN
jgi:hypothetical protein